MKHDLHDGVTATPIEDDLEKCRGAWDRLETPKELHDFPDERARREAQVREHAERCRKVASAIERSQVHR